MKKVLVKTLLFLVSLLIIMSTAQAQLSGNYIVGDGGDYTFLGQAIGDLGVNGASGDVTFIVEDGYNVAQTITFPAFAGDDTYTATIRPADNATNITFQGSTNGGIFRVRNVNNYIIDGADPITGNKVFTFDMGEGAFRHGFDLSGNNLTVKNCIFKIYDDNGIETPTFNSGFSNITIDNCDFINLNSSSDVTIRAIWIRYTDVPNFRIENCRFYSDPSSPDIKAYFPINSSGAVTAINNVINARADNFIGIYINDKDETAEIHHNTVNLSGSQNIGTPATVSGIFLNNRGSDPITVQNNIVNFTRSYPSGWTKLGLVGSATTASDNNIHIEDDTQSDFGYLTVGDNQTSVLSSNPTYTFSEPLFTDEANNDLTLTGASLTNPNFRGVNAGVTTDINGTSRNGTVPAKGAYEHANSIADIISFTGPNILSTTIDNSNSTIEFVLSNGSSQIFAPTIGLYADAQGISPSSGATQNFSSPVIYTVTAEDGTQDTWTVTNKIPNTEANITSFSVAEQTGPAIIDPINATIDIELGRNVPSPFTPTMTISDGATITTGYMIGESISYGFFISNRTLTILSEDGLTSKDWTIRMTLDPYEGGTYTVGAGDDFEDIEDAIIALDMYGYDGDVVLEIQSDYPSTIPSTTVRLDWLDVNAGSSLLIKPASDVTEVTIDMGTRSILFVGMQDFTIDGENKLKFVTTYNGYALVISGDAIVRNLEYETAGAFMQYSQGSLEMTGNRFVYNGSSFSPSTFFDIRNGVGIKTTIGSNLIDLGSGHNGLGKSLFSAFNINTSFINNVIHVDGVSWPSFVAFGMAPTGETAEVLHNTVFIEGTASGTEEITFATTTISTTTSSTVKIENNLVQMERNPGSSGKLVGINFRSITNQSYDGNNIFLQSGSHTRTYFEQLGSTLYDDSNLAAMLTAYPETSTESVSFVNTAMNDFYLSGASLSSQALRTTNLLADVTEDFLSRNRSVTAVTKGAYETPNNITEIFEVSLDELVGNTTIINGFSTISAEVAAGSGFNLDPSFTLFPGASINPNNGTTQDFTSAVIYTVTAEDGTTRDWSVTITEQNGAPTDVSLGSTDINENAGSNAVVGVLSGTDPNTIETFSYSLVAGTGGTDNALFNIDGSNLRATNSLDHEASDTRSVLIRVTDAGGLFFDKAFTISIADLNDAPNDIFLSNSSVQENLAIGTTVGTLTSADQDAGDIHTYSLKVGTPDNAFFSIDEDQLETNAVFDFETKDTYNLEIITNDGNGGQFEQEFAISISDEASSITDISLSGNNLNENQGQGIPIGTFTVQGIDLSGSYTYTFASGTGDAGNTAFNISNDQLLSFAGFNHEIFPTIDIRVEASGIGGSLEKVFTININDLVEVPTDIDLSNNSIQESLAIGTVVGTLSTTDQDEGETYTYTLVDGSGDSGNDSFQIVGDELRSNEVFDFETQTSYSVRIQTDDGNGNQLAESFTINIGDVGPSVTDIGLTNNQIDENNATPLTVGTFSTLGEEVTGSYTYSLVSGDGDGANTSFFIVGDELRTSAVFDHEIISSFSIRVRTDDGMGSFFEKAIALTVTDINEAPTSISLINNAFNETDDLGAITGFLVQDVDEGDSFTVTLATGSGDADNDKFSIVSGESPGTFALQNDVPFDFESQSSFSIRVNVQDAGGLSIEESITITVNDTNDDPTDILSTSNSINENSAPGSTVTSFSTEDQDASDLHTYTLVSGSGDEDNNAFQISDNNLLNEGQLNFENKSSYNVRIRSNDGNGGIIEEAFVISINDVNEAPTNIDLSNSSIDESTPIGTVIGSFSTDDEDAGDTHTYAVELGCDACDLAEIFPFTIVGNELRSNIEFDYENQSSYLITITSTDAGGLTDEQAFAIDINDLPASITSLDLSNQSINENESAGATVGSLTTTGEDLSGNYTYTLVSGDGDTDNASFTISNSDLQTAASFDFEAKSSYSIRIMTDDGSLTREETFTITVSDVSEAPTDISLSVSSIAENNAIDDAIGAFTTTDEDGGETHAYSLVNGDGDDDNGSFTLSGDIILAAEVFDFETKDSYSIRIQTNDGNGGIFAKAFTITIDNINESISVASPIDDQSLTEGFESADVDLNGVFVDEDGDALTYTAESSDNSIVSVAVSNSTLTLTEAGIGTVTITVTADDGSGQTTTDSFEVEVSETPLGLDEEISIEVYPNPTSDYININADKKLTIDLINLHGQTIQTIDGTNVRMDVRNISTGTYVLKISDGKSSVTRRIIKTN
ncbi:T9SS type A sorting domain-containing protein [Ekhidna sp.]